jgi:phage gp36-like protein
MSSAYCTSDDVTDRYGTPNVNAWADMEGLGATANADAIAARIADAIAYASDYIDDRLRGSNLSFVIPITGTVPNTLIDIARRIAAYHLSTARGVRDYDKYGNPITPLYADFRYAKQLLEAIATQKLTLDLAH